MKARSELRFECTGCCTSRGEYAHVYLNADELAELAAHLELSTRTFRAKYTFKDEYGWTQLRFPDSACIFLEPGTKRCTVYAARPTQCRTFPFWRELVEDGRFSAAAKQLCEGIGRGKLHSLEDAEARMLELEQADE